MKLQFVNRMCVCLIVLLSIVSGAFADPPAGNWTLIWSDEFDSGSTPEYPNPANWSYEEGYKRNQEWQYYTNALQNAYCQDGLLHIEAHQHPAGTYPTGSYTGQDGSISSASLKSVNKVEYQYGWLEMRARIDTRWGSWPAFWTLGTNGGWPDGGECDIMEYYRGMLKFNVAWWKTGDPTWTPRWDSATVYVSSLASGWADGFHKWAMEWTPDYVNLYLDGVLYNTWDSSQDDNGDGDTSTEGFQQPHYILLNQAIGGTAGGDASGLTYPTHYEIDYVRWYHGNATFTPPTNLAATAGDGSVSLDWADNTELGLSAYGVYRSDTLGGPYTRLADSANSDYVDSTVTNGATYYYVVTAIDTSNNESAYSFNVSATPRGGAFITIVNPSFEEPGTVKQTNWGSVPGWSSDTVASESGVESGGMDGAWEGYLKGSDPAVWQLTNHVLLAGETLELAVYSKLGWLGSTFTMALYYDNAGSRVTVASQQITLLSTWQEITLPFNVDDVPAAVGKQIGILLNNPSGAADWILIDNVRLFLTSGGDTTPPAAPSGLVATAGDGSVSLDWADNGESDLAGYSVYRSTTSGGGYMSIISGQTTSDYVDNGVTNGTTYYYVVTAADTSSNESPDSNQDLATPLPIGDLTGDVKVDMKDVAELGMQWQNGYDMDTLLEIADNWLYGTIPPSAPTGLVATAGDGYVSLDWADNTEPEIASYSVYRSTTSGSGHVSIASDVGTSDHVDNTVVNGTTYYYVVTATDISSNESPDSNESSATPQGCVSTASHAESIVCTTASGTQGKLYGQVTVTIYDNCGTPVSGADVTGTFSGSYNQTRSGTTNAGGTVVLTTTVQVRNPAYTFCVDTVVSGLTYDAGAGVTCGSY